MEEDVTPCSALNQPRDPVLEGDYSFNTGRLKQTDASDYVFFVGALVVSTLIGFYPAWQQRKYLGYDIYLLAGCSMSAVPVSLSLMASVMSALSLMGIPEDIYLYSTMYFWDVIPLIITGALTGTLYIPILYQLQVVTAHEYLEKRFNRLVRQLGAAFFVTNMVLYMTLAVCAPSLALNSVTNFNLWGSMIAVVVCSTAYVALGGIKAIICSDTVQVCIMLIGLSAVLVRATLVVGGLSSVWDSMKRSKRDIIANFEMDMTSDHSLWAYVFGSSVCWLGYSGINQNTVHKCLTCRSLRTAKMACFLTIPLNVLLHVMCCFMGMFMAAFYENCDPMEAGFIEGDNEIAIAFVKDIFSSTNLSGLYFAALLCGALSTISSCLNSAAYVLLEDFIRPCCKEFIDGSKAKRIMQVCCIVCGMVCLELAAVVQNVKIGLKAVNIIIGSLAIPVLGLFSLGMFFPHVNSTGAVAGVFISLIVSIVLAIVKQDVPASGLAETCVSNCNITILPNVTRTYYFHQHYKLELPVDLDDYNFLQSFAYWYNFPITMVVCLVIGLLVSYLTDFLDPELIDPTLIVPVFDVLFPFCYLPESIRRQLRFGIDHTDKWQELERVSITQDIEPVQLQESRRSVIKPRFVVYPVDAEGIIQEGLPHIKADDLLTQITEISAKFSIFSDNKSKSSLAKMETELN